MYERKKSKGTRHGGNPNNAAAKLKKPNPFELHINNTKLHVVGQKSKNGRGMPGVSRSRGNKIRERTLLDEYKNRHKSNVLKDRRIGENNPFMDPDKKVALRMAREMRRQLSKKSLYNLNDDDDGTEGMAEEKLSFNEGYNFSDDDDDDPDDKQLDYKYVKEQHFGGGGFLTRRNEESGETKDTGERQFKSKKERIEEIIAESKLMKANKKRDKEEHEDTVVLLDSLLNKFMKSNQSKITFEKITAEDKQKVKEKNEHKDYDKLTRELPFDRTKRGNAADRSKTPQEIAKDEKERLHALETARVSRMMGEEPTTLAKKAAYSADDLNDGFILNEDDRVPVSYKDGRLLTEDNPSQEQTEDDQSDQSDDKRERTQTDVDAEGSEDDNDSEDTEDESDNYSDILEDDDDTEEDNDKDAKKISLVKSLKDLQKKKLAMDAAKKEIPYTFEVPQEYDSFISLLEERSPADVAIILQRMISCNHPSLGNNNTAKCQEVFKYLLQTVHIISSRDAESFKEGVNPLKYFTVLIPPLYDLTQLFPTYAAESLLSVIEEKYSELSSRKVKRYPMADTFTFLKICGMLFPASDYQHVVMTPVICFLSQLLNQCRLNTRRDFTAALFTASLTYEYIHTSKRFLPELCNLLNGIIFLCIPGKDKTRLPYTGAPFKLVGPQSLLLVLDKPMTECTPTRLTVQSLNEENTLTEEFKITILEKTLQLLNKVYTLWLELPAFYAIMEPTSKLLNSLILENYPHNISSCVEELKSTFNKRPTKLEYLKKKSSKPKSLKMYEPSIERVIDGVKKRSGDKAFQEKQKLFHKVKQERKTARRELKKDTAFIAKYQLKETLASDAERKRKVNRIISELGHQESDYKKMKRKKF